MTDKSLERKESLYAKVLDSNIKISELKKYNISQWNKALGTKVRKKKSLEGQKRLLDQIQTNIEPISVRYNFKKKIKNPKIKATTIDEGKRLFGVKQPTKPKVSRQKQIKLLKEGSYITTVIYTNDGEKFISSSNNKDFKRQLAILDDAYGVLSIGDCGRSKPRKPFLTKQIKEYYLTKGIEM